MLERTAYEASSGQLLSGSFMDYCLPRAADLPNLEIHLNGVPTTANPLGSKGAGQAGAIAAPQAVVSAVLDALAPLGISHIDMPVTAEAVWRAMQTAR
jgi:carbon-monoxide dehydrogenase large subunit